MTRRTDPLAYVQNLGGLAVLFVMATEHSSWRLSRSTVRTFGT
jgi:hypothetical protein